MKKQIVYVPIPGTVGIVLNVSVPETSAEFWSVRGRPPTAEEHRNLQLK